MQKIKKIIKRIAFATMVFPAIALAIPTAVDPVEGSANVTLSDLLQNVINYILAISAGIAVLFLIVGGIKYIASQGNEESIESAKHTILYSIIGLLVIVLSFVIVTFITNQAGNLVQ